MRQAAKFDGGSRKRASSATLRGLPLFLRTRLTHTTVSRLSLGARRQRSSGINSEARVPTCLVGSQGFESPMPRHFWTMPRCHRVRLRIVGSRGDSDRRRMEGPADYFVNRWTSGEVARLSIWKDGFDSRTVYQFWIRNLARYCARMRRPGVAVSPARPYFMNTI